MKIKRRREKPTVRREEILNAAVHVACKLGYQSITRESVANAAQTSCALVTRYFVTMDCLKRAVVDTAIEREILPIVAQVISLGDKQTANIKNSLKQKVIAFIKG